MHPCLEKYSNQFPIQHSFLSSVYRVSVLSISHQTSICWHDLPLFDVTSLATLSRNNPNELEESLNNYWYFAIWPKLI